MILGVQKLLGINHASSTSHHLLVIDEGSMSHVGGGCIVVKHLAVYKVEACFLHHYMSGQSVVEDISFPVLLDPVCYASTVTCKRKHIRCRSKALYCYSNASPGAELREKRYIQAEYGCSVDKLQFEEFRCNRELYSSKEKNAFCIAFYRYFGVFLVRCQPDGCFHGSVRISKRKTSIKQHQAYLI